MALNIQSMDVIILLLIWCNGVTVIIGMEGGMRTARQGGMPEDDCSSMYACSGDVYGQQRGCACDDMCHVYGDCCEDKARDPNVTNPVIHHLDLTMYGNCTSILGYPETVFVVDKCPVEYEDDDIKLGCEDIDINSGDVYYRIPVSHDKHGIIYNNLYCAMCHGWTKDQVSFWGGEMQCVVPPDDNIESDLNCAVIDPYDIWCSQFVAEEENRNTIIGKPSGITNMDYLKTLTPKELLELGLCTFKFTPSINMEKPRICRRVDEACPLTWTDEHIRNQCEKGINAYVWPYEFGLPYKNKHCAICNSVVHYACSQVFAMVSPETKGAPSISILLDFNNEQSSSETHSGSCDHGFVYDIIMTRCRPLFCSPGFSLNGDRCVSMASGTMEKNVTDYEGITSCAKVQVDEGGYIFLSDESVYINASDIIFPLGEYIFENSSVLVCAYNFSQNYTYIESVFNYSIVQGVISMTGQVISIIALCVLLFVYCTNKPLQTVPGKCLICLSAFLALAQFFFIIGGFSRDAAGFCHFLAIVTHFCFLASFFWMNVMGFDVWKTFHDQFSFSSGSKRMKKFTGYCIYAFSLPMIIVILGIILDNVGHVKVKPHYGDGFCWINDKYALLYLFSLPLFIILGFNIIFFSLAVYNICKVSEGTKVLRKKKPGVKTKRLVLYIKLSSVMGLTWIFGFLAAFTKSLVLWYFFVIFNPLQGLFICIAFVCNRKVFRIMTRYRERVSSAFNSFTMSSRLSSRRSSSQDTSRKYSKTRSLRIEVSDPDKASTEPGPISNPEHD